MLAARGVTPVVIGTAPEQRWPGDRSNAAARDRPDRPHRLRPSSPAWRAPPRIAIGNDTGPMHLIAAAGCPSVVLFSRDSDPALCAPRGPARHACCAGRTSPSSRPTTVLRAAAATMLPADGRRAGRRLMADTSRHTGRDLAVPDGVPLPQRYWAILTIALGLTLAVLDGAIANVALPTIARDLDASPASSIWVVNAYQLAVTISLLPLASLGDIYGYRRVYQCGLVVFTIASLGCALSDSLATLTIARIVQGFGAAGIMSVNGALVRFIYPRRWLGRGVGLNATIGSIASAVGPTVAAGILSVGPWPWLFAVNVPIGAAGDPDRAGARCRDTPSSGARFDAPSALLERADVRPADHRDRRTGPWRERQPGRRRTVLSRWCSASSW